MKLCNQRQGMALTVTEIEDLRAYLNGVAAPTIMLTRLTK
ncbi:MAG: hypothetical protein BWY02_02754 [bacterium ADurb.Bin157]|nr:MAG: hypothetical protein BWY02_02754 [bacterium ADurb.Bin157]